MGVDFIRKRAKTFNKGWDRHRVELSTPDLFTQRPECIVRAAVARRTVGSILREGDDVIVRAVGSELVVLRGITEIARFVDPPPDVVHAVAECGVAHGTVASLQADGDIAEIKVW